MYVLFDENGREYLRAFNGITAEMKKLGILVNENDVPVKDKCTTVIYKNSDNTVRYEFKPIPEKETDVLLKALNDLQLKTLELERGIK